ncbi:MAG: response regulator [Patescibacteria group bacterium]
MTKTILVVEDEKPLAEAVKLKLAKLDFNVSAVPSAEEALEIMKKNDIDLIWLDLRLPKMHGLDFLKILRNDSRFKDKKVVIVSVSGGEEIKEKAEKLGITDYLVKSEYKLDEIISRVTKHI